MRWTVRIDGGPRRVNHAAVCMGNKIYSFGGYCSSEEYKDWDPIPVLVLNTATLRWTPVDYVKNEHVPFQRYGHTAIAVGHKVYMWGGRNSTVACDTLTCFDTKTLKWSTPSVTGMVPYAKDGHSACLIKNKMYIFGGFAYVTDQYSQDVHCLDLNTMHWTVMDTKGHPPSHRDFHTAVSYGDRMYIFGGRGDLNNPYNSQEELYCPEVFYLDVSEEKWYNVKPRSLWPEGRRSHSAWVYEDYMYVFGGYNGKNMTHYNDLYRYSLKHNYWELMYPHGVPPCERRRQACLMVDNKAYLFGGTSPHPNAKVIDNDDEEDTERLIDNSDLHILDFSPTLKTLCILAVIDYNLDVSCLPHHIVLDIKALTTPNRISRPSSQMG